MAFAAGPGPKERFRLRADPLNRCHANLIANLVTFRAGRWANTGDQIARLTPQRHHPPYDRRNDPCHGGPPGGMRETSGSVLSVGDQYQRAIATLAQQRQPCGGGHQSIGRASQSPCLTCQDLTAMDLIQKGNVVKAQNSCDLTPRGSRVISNEIHIGTLPSGDEVGYTQSLQRREAASQPPVGQRL